MLNQATTSTAIMNNPKRGDWSQAKASMLSMPLHSATCAPVTQWGIMIVLHAYGARAPTEIVADLTSNTLPVGVLWIDLLRPDPPEIAFVQRVPGVRVPSLDELKEIESSSRLRREQDAFY